MAYVTLPYFLSKAEQGQALALLSTKSDDISSLQQNVTLANIKSGSPMLEVLPFNFLCVPEAFSLYIEADFDLIA